MKDIAIYGAGGLGREVRTIIDAINKRNQQFNFIGYFDDGKEGENVLGSLNDLNNWKKPIDVIVAIGSPTIKATIVQSIKNSMVNYPTIVHPAAIIAEPDHIQLGEGTVIGAGAILTTDICVGSHVLVNLNVTIGHDAILGNFTSVMPGTNIAGNVSIDDLVLIGSGANLINAVRVGSRSVIGAGSVVLKEVKAHTTVVGVPAKEKR